MECSASFGRPPKMVGKLRGGCLNGGFYPVAIKPPSLKRDRRSRSPCDGGMRGIMHGRIDYEAHGSR